MAGTFFFNEADATIFEAIKRRAGLIDSNYQQSVMERNAYCEIKTKDGTVIYDAADGGVNGGGRSFAATYVAQGTGKPKPQLLKLEVTIEGSAGSLRRCNGSFLCHDLESFNDLEQKLLLPATEITIQYGYAHAVDAADTSPVLDFTVYDYSFLLNDVNNIECSFKAVGKGQEILEANAFNTAYYHKLSNGSAIPFFVADYNYTNELVSVSSLADALDYLVQWETGHLNRKRFDVPTNSGWYHDKRPNFPSQGRQYGARTGLDFCVMAAPSDYEAPGKQKVGSDTFDRITYYSLGFICWVINNYITFDEPTFIVCDGFTTIGRKGKNAWQAANGTSGKNKTVNTIPLVSADPIMVAFLAGGGVKGWDNYTDGGDLTDTDNLRFDSIQAADKATITGGDLSRILVSRDCIQALQESYSTVDSSGKDTSKISIKRFLGDIFATIKDCSGGGINLFMISDTSNEYPDVSRLLVKNGNEPPTSKPKVVQFDPLPASAKGDGITKSIKLTGKVPKGLQAEAFGSTPGSGDAGAVITALTEDDGDAVKQKADLKTRYEDAHNNLAYNDFDAASVTGLKGVLKEIVDNEEPETLTKNKAIPYPLEMECLLHGIYGFKFGDTVSSKHLPRRYTKVSGMRVGFTVTGIKDKIAGDKWTTELTTTCRIVNN